MFAVARTVVTRVGGAAAGRAAACVLALALVAASGSSRARAEGAGQGDAYFPDVTFTTQDGTRVRFYDDLIKGKIVAINLIYTSCKYACPLETAKLAQVQRLLGDRMGRDIFFYSITIDPEHDTPAVLKEYAEKYHAGPGWLFLTGKRADIERVAKRLGLFSERDRATADGHVPFLLIGNEATGQWMRNSAMDNPDFMARTIGDWLTSWQTASTEPARSYAEVAPLTLNPGEYAFAKQCAACHTIGRGDHIGPDLHGVTRARDRAWLSRFIVTPEKVRAEGDPIALALRAKYGQVRMPSLDLSNAEAAAIIDYLDAKSGAGGNRNTAAVESHPATRADAVRADLAALVEPYLQIQQTLISDETAGVAERARAVASAAAQGGARMEAVRSFAAELAAANRLEDTRAAFGRLSEALVALVKEPNTTVPAGIEVAYCPMVRTHWLQKGATIQNPYYGSSMLGCGRVVR